MEAKSGEKLSKLDETKQSNRPEETKISSANKIEKSVEQPQEAIANKDLNLTAEDAEVWKAYLASVQRWEEVYRRLANS